MSKANITSAVLSHCLQSVKSGPGDAMRSLISLGLRSGHLPFAGEPSVRCISTVQALISNYKATKFYDFGPIKKMLCDVEQSTGAVEFVDLLETITELGHYDEDIVLTLLLRTLESGDVRSLSAQDKLRLISLLARQQCRVEDVVIRLAEQVSPELTDSQRFKLLRYSSALKVEFPFLLSLVGDPHHLMDCVNIAYAFALSPKLLNSVDNFQFLLLPALRRLSETNAIAELRKEQLRELAILWYAMSYTTDSDLVRSLEPPIRRLFAGVCSNPQNPFRPGRKSVPNKEFTQSVSDILYRMNIRHDANVTKGPFSVDLIESERNIVWECNGSRKFYTGGSEKVKSAYSDLQERVMRGMGYQVVKIPIWHWIRLRNQRVRLDYCRMNRHLALGDIRERGTRSDKTADPSAFAARGVALNGSQEFEFHGEYFFTKEQPKRPWVWHGSSGVPIKMRL